MVRASSLNPIKIKGLKFNAENTKKNPGGSMEG